jgi:hypothetical protein
MGKLEVNILGLKKEFTQRLQDVKTKRQHVLACQSSISQEDLQETMNNLQKFQVLKAGYLKDINQLHYVGLQTLGRLDYLKLQKTVTELRKEVD